MDKEICVGIDLGTTNSCCSYMNGSEPTVIKNSEKSNITPSAVCFKLNGDIIVGQTAKDMLLEDPENVVVSIKRKMGTDIRRNIRGRDYRPEEISALILQKLKKEAEGYIGKEVKYAVITVPANFNSLQRQATKDAGEIAGFKVLRVVNEPTAAALAFGQKKKLGAILVVFDLGGGTFDISVVKLSSGVYEVIYSLGDNDLGGDDFNIRIISKMCEEFKRTHGIDITADREALRRMRLEAIRIKHALTDTNEVKTELKQIALVDGVPQDLLATFTREIYEEVSGDLIDRIRRICRKVVKELQNEQYVNEHGDVFRNKLAGCDVILVGGETRVPMIRRILKEEFEGRLHSDVNPDEVVSLGAAIQGGILMNNPDLKNILLIDTTSLTLGVQMLGDVYSRIIRANTRIPVERKESYQTVSDFQTAVKVNVYQGESDIASQNRHLGTIEHDGIPPKKAGEANILVTFQLDANDILTVIVRESETGTEKIGKIKGSQNLPREEIERLKREAKEREDENRILLEAYQLRTKAEEIVRSAVEIMEMFGSSLNPDVKARMEELMKTLTAAVSLNDNQKIKDLLYEFAKLLPKPALKQPRLIPSIMAVEGFTMGKSSVMQVQIVNSGNGPAKNLVVHATGSFKKTKSNNVELISPGETKKVEIDLMPLQSGSNVSLYLKLEYSDENGMPLYIAFDTKVPVTDAKQPKAERYQAKLDRPDIVTSIFADLIGDEAFRFHEDEYGHEGDPAQRNPLGMGKPSVGGMPGLSEAQQPRDNQKAYHDMGETIRCHNCGALIPSGFAFCGKCGVPFQEKAGRLCIKCGNNVPIEYEFCMKCGNRF